MLIAAAAAVSFIPVTAVADVTTSKGSTYRVETCFLSPDHLATGFFYPDHETTLVLRDGKVQVAETGKAETTGGEEERRVAFGHNFHAILFNAQMWPGEDARPIPHGGTMTVLATTNDRPSTMRFDLPGTTPIEVIFTDWRGKVHTPYRMTLRHDGVTYDYRYRTVERSCDLP